MAARPQGPAPHLVGALRHGRTELGGSKAAWVESRSLEVDNERLPVGVLRSVPWGP